MKATVQCYVSCTKSLSISTKYDISKIHYGSILIYNLMLNIKVHVYENGPVLREHSHYSYC